MDGQKPAPMKANYEAEIIEHEVWVAVQDDVITGYLVLIPGQSALALDNLAVDPLFQSQGIGRGLLAFAEERASAAGYDRIALYTNAVMVENQRLYERLGYIETGRRSEQGFSRVFYEKDLQSEDRQGLAC